MGTTRVYLGGLSNRAREDDVEKFFKGSGTIREVILKNGFCFVVSFSIMYSHPTSIVRRHNSYRFN